jgi:phage tail tape-measure protein
MCHMAQQAGEASRMKRVPVNDDRLKRQMKEQTMTNTADHTLASPMLLTNDELDQIGGAMGHINEITGAAAAGAALGSAFGPVGTVVGGAVGGLLGWLFG